LFRGERHNIGIFGTLGSPEALEVIGKADCLVVFGCGLNPRTTDQGALVRGKRIVQIDIEVAQLGATIAPDAAVVGDVAATARVIAEWLERAEAPTTKFASDDLAALLANAPQSAPLAGLRPETVDLRMALRALERAVPAERSLVVDGGRFFWESVRELSVQNPGSYVHALDIGSIGMGVALAIGTSTAVPDRPTLLIVGDGSFMLNGLQEFNTAVRHGCDLIVALMNDGAYGAEHIQFAKRGMSAEMSLFNWPDFARVAESLGGAGFTVTSEDDLAKLGKLVEGRSGPLLIDVRLDPERVPFDGAH
jgi:thiamine pyrophosphate-dependent acetolactate synthase large subunit-like protein